MNLQILSAQIVRCVHHSPDSVINLEQVVIGLIREEQERSLAVKREIFMDESEKSLAALNAELQEIFSRDPR